MYNNADCEKLIYIVTTFLTVNLALKTQQESRLESFYKIRILQSNYMLQ